MLIVLFSPTLICLFCISGVDCWFVFLIFEFFFLYFFFLFCIYFITSSALVEFELTTTFHIWIDMDKSWMLLYHNRFSQPYIDGVNSFIEFAKANSGGSRVIKCPCNYCCNSLKHDYEIVRDHRLVHGMLVSYDT